MPANNRPISKYSILLLALLLPLTAIMAQGALQVQDQQGVRFVSGGVGLSEREAIQALSSDFNLRLSFALNTGNFLSGVEVRFADRNGNAVLASTSNGPIFLANLPAGSYTIEASFRGETQRSSVQVGSGQRELIFRWNDG
jgi:hypothetical protein